MVGDARKFAHTVLYILARLAPHQPGTTSLIKLVFLADYLHYKRHLHPITGVRYVALEKGPVPDGYKQRLAEMERAGVIRTERVQVLDMPQLKVEYAPLQEPDERMFLRSEAEILDEVVGAFGRQPGYRLSERTHREGPWALAWNEREPGREIPYALFRWIENLPTEDDLEVAKQSLSRPEVASRVRALNEAAIRK